MAWNQLHNRKRHADNDELGRYSRTTPSSASRQDIPVIEFLTLLCLSTSYHFHQLNEVLTLFYRELARNSTLPLPFILAILLFLLLLLTGPLATLSIPISFLVRSIPVIGKRLISQFRIPYLATVAWT